MVFVEKRKEKRKDRGRKKVSVCFCKGKDDGLILKNPREIYVRGLAACREIH